MYDQSKTSFIITEENSPDEAMFLLPSRKHSGRCPWNAECSGLEATQEGVVEDQQHWHHLGDHLVSPW